MSFWPPYFFAGIRVKSVCDDFLKIKIEMKQRPYNTNYVGSHFGGSLYSMCDPWYMFILLEHLGKDYIVWDKKASIDFKYPGKGTVFAEFTLSKEDIAHAKKMADENHKFEPEYQLKIFDKNQEVVAIVNKTLYIKRKVRSLVKNI
jgi:hypothetical protein